MTITAIREGSPFDAIRRTREATCDWVPVKDANARRAQARRQARIDKLRAQIEALTALDQEAAS